MSKITNRRVLSGLLILVLAVTVAGCLGTESVRQETGKLVVEEVALEDGTKVTSGTVKINGQARKLGETIELTAGSYTLTVKTKANNQNYAASKEVVVKAGEVTTISDNLTLQSGTKLSSSSATLTVDYPDQIVAGEAMTFSGTVSSSIHKVIISVDGYALTDANGNKNIYVENGEYELNYTFDSPGQDRKLVVNAFDENGNSVKQVTEYIDVLKDKQLTLNYPDSIKVGEEITFSGQALDPINKVIISVDGYPLTDADGNKDIYVENGQYKLDYTFSSPGEDRKLVVNAFDVNGNSVKQVTEYIDIQPDRVELDVPYYYQLNNDYEPYSTCNITALAMALSYNTQTIEPDTIYLYEGDPVYTGTDLERLAHHYGATNSTYHAGVGKATVKNYLDQGVPVIFQGQFTSGDGHMILLVGYDDTGWIVNDPFGEWTSSGYINNSTAGDGIHYSYDLVDNNSIGGWNNYYITAVH